MTTEDFIISLFCLVDDRMGKVEKRSDAMLYPSELVTIGLLYALKGGFFRAFYRWLKRDFESLFVRLPDRTRIQRALRSHREWADCLLADPTFFTVIDTYGIELIHPRSIVYCSRPSTHAPWPSLSSDHYSNPIRFVKCGRLI